jgi:hypothetical protein
MEQKILNWIKDQQEVISKVIFDAGQDFYSKNRNKDNFCFDLSECQLESYNLVNHKDLCYDRICTGFSYSLWYHARRVNTFINYFVSAILNSPESHIKIFDLGAGTGAVQFAVGLVYLGMKKLGLNPPKISIINVDSSPMMLYYNRDYLWKHFKKNYQQLNTDNFTVEYTINSWNAMNDFPISNPWLVASYLFDISDQAEAISIDFLELISTYRPGTLLLLTSAQKEKVKIFNSVVDKIKYLGYEALKIDNSSLLFSGSLVEVNKFKFEVNKTCPAKGLGSNTQWKDESFIGAVLKHQKQTFDFPVKSISKLNLYNSKIKVRKEIELNKRQKEASEFVGRPSVIVGPAGSGKSIVISEKIKNICKTAGYNPNLKILVTSFNKGLIRKLGDWIEDLIKPAPIERRFIRDIHGYADEACDFYFQDSLGPNITMLNFDLLPTKIGNLTAGRLVFDTQQLFNIKACIEHVKLENNIDKQYENVLTPEFILEEYHRIFYGLRIKDREEYLKVKRSGRWLGLNKERREIVYKCVEKYRAYNDKNNIDSITTRRELFLKKIIDNRIERKFDYIFVDEFQDCTRADYEIFYGLIKDVNNLTLGGDLAQAIHIGKSADIPRDDRMRRREYFLLEGSYRLPQRISESIKTLSTTIVNRWNKNEASKEIAPVKKSPPGARPIVVYGSTMEGIVKKVKAIFDSYSCYDFTKITILEKDESLKNAIEQQGVRCETDTILKLKGLEKDCILWSTRIEIDDVNEIYEFVYTILTRTSCILIIALSDTTMSYYKKVINLLIRDKIILWDSETKNKYNLFCETVEIEMLNSEAE